MPYIIEIDRTGDLTLILSKGLPVPIADGTNTDASTPTTSLLVSSKILALASPVFAALLSPRFREGQRSPSSGTLDPISLPDDDAAAMTTLCQIFHFRHDGDGSLLAPLPTEPSLELFQNLAVLSDKYDCVAPMRFVAETWLVAWEAEACEEDLEILLFVSYMFGRAERFTRISKRIVAEFRGNLKRLPILSAFDEVPVEVLRGLQQQRKTALKMIEDNVARHLENMAGTCQKSFATPLVLQACPKCSTIFLTTSGACNKCRTAANAICGPQSRQGQYVSILKDAGLNPVKLWSVMSTKSVNEIASSLVAARSAAVYEHKCNGGGECHLGYAVSRLNEAVKDLANNMAGLCLDCINAEHENVNFKPDSCVNHGKHASVPEVVTNKNIC